MNRFAGVRGDARFAAQAGASCHKEGPATAIAARVPP